MDGKIDNTHAITISKEQLKKKCDITVGDWVSFKCDNQ